MTDLLKNIVCLLLTFTIIGIGCKTENVVKNYHTIQGKSMGTFYTIKYRSIDDFLNLKTNIDSCLNVFEDELSTYRPESLISKFNRDDRGICVDTNSYFHQSIKRSKSLHEFTQGYYDPTISPLVNYWGFGHDKQPRRSSINRDTLNEILLLVGFNKIQSKVEHNKICYFKSDALQSLNVNASAKGKGVDIIADIMRSNGIEDFMVEVGGEVVAQGKNESGAIWSIGISRPQNNANPNDVLIPINLSNAALASSGNYRQYYKEDSLTFAHIINPMTGIAQPTDILSATVMADDCETADAFATALMAMGLEKSKVLANKINNIKTCLIYYDSEGDSLAYFYSNGFEQQLK